MLVYVQASNDASEASEADSVGYKRSPSAAKLQNLELNINSSSNTPSGKSNKSNKSPLLLLQHKMRHKQEYDALEALRKRREQIQQRLDAINNRQRDRQRKNVNRYNYNFKSKYSRYNKNKNKQAEPKVRQNLFNRYSNDSSKNGIDHSSRQRSKSEMPPSHPSQPQGIKSPLLFKAPAKKLPSTSVRSTKSNSSSSSNSGSRHSSKSNTPIRPRQSSLESNSKHLSHKERIAAKKIAEADARAAAIAESQKKDFEVRQIQAQQTKIKVHGADNRNVSESPLVGVEDTSDDIVYDQSPGSDVVSEPAFIKRGKSDAHKISLSDVEDDANISDTPNDIDNSDNDIQAYNTDDENEDKELQKEIDILKQTLAEQTAQIRQLKETLHQRKADELKTHREHLTSNHSNNDENQDDSDDSGSDVETLLFQQELSLRNQAKQKVANLKRKMNANKAKPKFTKHNDTSKSSSTLQAQKYPSDTSSMPPLETNIDKISKNASPDNRTFNQYKSYDEYLQHIEKQHFDAMSRMPDVSTDYPIQKIQEESGEYEEDCASSSSGSSDDDKLHTGKLADRVAGIKQKCISKMGQTGFHMGYQYLKKLETTEDIEPKEKKINTFRKLFKEEISNKKIQKYIALIDQLLFIEANYS